MTARLTSDTSDTGTIMKAERKIGSPMHVNERIGVEKEYKGSYNACQFNTAKQYNILNKCDTFKTVVRHNLRFAES